MMRNYVLIFQVYDVMFKLFEKEISVDLMEVLKCLETSFSAEENGDIYSS